jgi:antagonist of KipI
LHFPAATILFNSVALIALAGADLAPHINGELVPAWQPLIIPKKAVLSFNKKVSGARVYLAIAGGFELAPWLGSYSTNLQAGMGGYKGRLLKKDDEINLGTPALSIKDTHSGKKDFTWRIIKPDYDNKLKLLLGRHWPEIRNAGQQDFLQHEFIITSKANRMGYQLAGPGINIENAGELTSSAVNFGAIQLLPGGQLIILGADHQATGGYPVIGHLVAAHFHKLAQLNAGDSISFEIITHDEALELLSSQQQNLLQLQNAVNLRLTEIFK